MLYDYILYGLSPGDHVLYQLIIVTGPLLSLNHPLVIAMVQGFSNLIIIIIEGIKVSKVAIQACLLFKVEAFNKLSKVIIIQLHVLSVNYHLGHVLGFLPFAFLNLIYY